MPHHRRRNRLRRFLAAAGGVTVGALLIFAGGHGSLHSRPLGLGADSWSLQQDRLFPPPPELLRSLPPELLPSPPPQVLLSPLPSPAHQQRNPELPFPRRLLPLRHQSTPQHHQVDAVLLPDREVLVLANDEPAAGKATCMFQGGPLSPARALGRLPGPGRHAFLCLMPDSALLCSSAAAAPPAPDADFGKMLNWNDSLVFDSATLHGGDVIVFAKGPNRRRGVINTAAANVQCVYRGGADGTEASFPAIASAQQLIRLLACFHSVGLGCYSGCRCGLVGAGGCCC